ncbi:MAG: peptidylprolyl isomerase [Chloroflexota bacterium]
MENEAVQDGVVVALEYTLWVDGEVVDASREEPLEYLHGFNNIIPGLEKELYGLHAGDEKEIIVHAEQAYGLYHPEGVFELPKSQFPPSFPFEIGYPFRVRTDKGQILNARIVGIKEEMVEIDTNHPLAGKDLRFFVRIAGIRQATAEELVAGRVGGACATCGSTSGCESCG